MSTWTPKAALATCLLLLSCAPPGPAPRQHQAPQTRPDVRVASTPVVVGHSLEPKPLTSLTLQAREGPRPVLLLMLDTTRLENLQAYGYHRETSPNLTKLAGEGVRFDGMYANASWTRPSVASMFTGLYRTTHGVSTRDATLPDHHVTLAEVFERNGFATAAFVANPLVGRAQRFDQGFARFEDTKDLGANPPAARVLGRARAWLESNTNPDFFLFVFLFDAHHPFTPPAEHDLWREGNTAAGLRNPFKEYRTLPAADVVRRTVSLYDAELRAMDHQIGRFFDALRRLGVWDDLTVVVIADHGEMLGEHNVFRHAGHMYEQNLRLPLIIKSPFLAEVGGRDVRLHESVDLMPSLAALTGLDAPPSAGRSMLDAPPHKAVGRRSVLAELEATGLRRYALRSGPHKLIRDEPSHMPTVKASWPQRWRDMVSTHNTTRRQRVFDVVEDPAERSDLSAHRPALRSKLEALLEARLEAIGAPKGAAGPRGGQGEELDGEDAELLRELGYVE